MSGVVNADEAERCLEIARSALQAGHPEKAGRFAEKAMKLYPSDEARKVVRAVRSQTHQASTSSSRPPTAPTGLHHRQAASNGNSTPPPPEDQSTPEQREMVRTILAKKDDMYAVLSLSRNAGDDEIKKAYRKLALKLHPDKNKARGADEAFKVVSKAFSCLSDSDKRARYDRYGEETPGLSRTASGRPMHGEFDADEIFNAFFGGRPSPIFRTHFGGPFQRAGPEGNGQPQSPLLGLITIAPIILFLLFTFLSSHNDPVFALDRTGSFVYELQTSKLNVPFFVKSVPDLDKQYPSSSVYRLRLEREVEGLYQERLSQKCYKEQLEQRRLYQWGYSTQAKAMTLPSCKEFNERFGHRTSQYGYAI